MSRHSTRYSSYNNDDIGEALTLLGTLIVSLILAGFSLYYWWHADEAWLTALRLSITNIVWTSVVGFALGFHWALGLVAALGVGTFFIAVW